MPDPLQAPPIIDNAVPADAVDRSWVGRAPQNWQPYLRLMRLDRPIGTWLLFWPCVFGLTLGATAQSRPFGEPMDLWYLLLMAAGSIIMRGAGCAFNDIVDRNIDGAVARTAGRPIPSGDISVKRALLFTALLCLTGLVILLQFNRPAIYLGIGSLALVVAYPFMKRITWWPQAWLGLTFNWGALLGFAATTGDIEISDLFLYGGLIFWTLGYDTIYAHQDKEYDALIGVKSSARRLGSASGKWILRFYAIAFTCTLAAGFIAHAGWPFVFLMLVAGAHLLWQIRRLDIDNGAVCLTLFRANRETGALIAAALILAGWIG